MVPSAFLWILLIPISQVDVGPPCCVLVPLILPLANWNLKHEPIYRSDVHSLVEFEKFDSHSVSIYCQFDILIGHSFYKSCQDYASLTPSYFDLIGLSRDFNYNSRNVAHSYSLIKFATRYTRTYIILYPYNVKYNYKDWVLSDNIVPSGQYDSVSRDPTLCWTFKDNHREYLTELSHRSRWGVDINVLYSDEDDLLYDFDHNRPRITISRDLTCLCEHYYYTPPCISNSVLPRFDVFYDISVRIIVLVDRIPDIIYLHDLTLSNSSPASYLCKTVISKMCVQLHNIAINIMLKSSRTFCELYIRYIYTAGRRYRCERAHSALIAPMSPCCSCNNDLVRGRKRIPLEKWGDSLSLVESNSVNILSGATSCICLPNWLGKCNDSMEYYIIKDIIIIPDIKIGFAFFRIYLEFLKIISKNKGDVDAESRTGVLGAVGRLRCRYATELHNYSLFYDFGGRYFKFNSGILFEPNFTSNQLPITASKSKQIFSLTSLVSLSVSCNNTRLLSYNYHSARACTDIYDRPETYLNMVSLSTIADVMLPTYNYTFYHTLKHTVELSMISLPQNTNINASNLQHSQLQPVSVLATKTLGNIALINRLPVRIQTNRYIKTNSISYMDIDNLMSRTMTISNYSFSYTSIKTNTNIKTNIKTNRAHVSGLIIHNSTKLLPIIIAIILAAAVSVFLFLLVESDTSPRPLKDHEKESRKNSFFFDWLTLVRRNISWINTDIRRPMILVMTATESTDGVNSNIHESDNTMVQSHKTPSSTPKKSGYKSRIHTDGDQDLFKFHTQSLSLTPDMKLQRTIRIRSHTLSQTSNMSTSSESPPLPSKSKNTTAKLICESGTFYLDRAKKCHLHYMDNMLTENETDSVLSELNSLTRADFHPEKFNIQFNCKESDEDNTKKSFYSTQIESKDLNQLIAFYTQKVESAARNIFDLDVDVQKVILSKLINDKDSTAYESYFDNRVSTTVPVVGVLTVGSTRPLYLKRVTSKRVTHQVALYAGSLCLMSGRTQMEYKHSIPKGYGLHEQITMFFIGMPTKEYSSCSDTGMTTEGYTTDVESVAGSESSSLASMGYYNSDIDSQFNPTEVFGTSIPNSNQAPDIPSITVTEAHSPNLESLNSENNKQQSHLLVTVDSTNQEQGDQKNDMLHPITVPATISPIKIQHHDTRNESSDKMLQTMIESQSDDDQEETVIQAHSNDEDVLLSETLVVCINNIPTNSLNKELRRYGYSTVGSLDSKRNRLTGAVCSKFSKLVQKTKETVTPKEVQRVDSTSLDSIEPILLEMNERISLLAEDLKNVKQIVEQDKLLSSVGKNPPPHTESNTIKKMHNKIEELIDMMNEDRKTVDDIYDILKSTKVRQFKAKGSTVSEEINKYFNEVEESRKSESESVDRFKDVDPRVPTPTPVYQVETSNPYSPLLDKDEDIQSSNAQPSAQKSDNSDTWLHPSRRLNQNSSTSERVKPTNSNDYHPSSNNQNLPGRLPYSYHLKSLPKPVSVPRRSSSHQEPLRSTNDQNTKKREPTTTLLITDSIMRRIKDNELGVNHKLHIAHKRDSTGLAHNQLRETIKKIKPDFIYIHLGINDIRIQRPVKQIMAAFGEFMLFIDEEVDPLTKIIFSMPLLNGNKNDYPHILELRSQLHYWITTLDTKVGIWNRQLLFNPNTNFFRRDAHGNILRNMQVTEYFNTRKGDYVHLNDFGQKTILANFRYIIHRITRESNHFNGRYL